jgi:hypothetical protein
LVQEVIPSHRMAGNVFANRAADDQAGIDGGVLGQ